MELTYDPSEELSLKEVIEKNYENLYYIKTKEKFEEVFQCKYFFVNTWNKIFSVRNINFELTLYRMFLLKFDEESESVIIYKDEYINNHSYFNLELVRDKNINYFIIEKIARNYFTYYKFNPFEEKRIDYNNIVYDDFPNNLIKSMEDSIDSFLIDISFILNQELDKIKNEINVFNEFINNN